jgi:hypothetical protein
MRPSARLGAIVLVIVATVFTAGTRVQAWSSATHVYIAQHVYPNVVNRTDLYYGAISPDVSIYVTKPNKWPSAFWDTHWLFIDLRPWAQSAAQRAFVRGWNSHNEFRGADHYAHGVPRLVHGKIVYQGGYITDKTDEIYAVLQAQGYDLPEDLVHILVETAVDVLLKREAGNDWVAPALFDAARNHSLEDSSLLRRVFTGWPFRRTDPQTLASSEVAFNTIELAYAQALNLPANDDLNALSLIGVGLAQQMYGVTVEPVDVRKLLDFAMSQCYADYNDAINDAINGIPRW